MSERQPRRFLSSQEVSAWRTQTATVLSTEEEQAADVDEPPDQRTPQNTFYRSTITSQKSQPCESLLTRALHTDTECDFATNFARRRSLVSLDSAASTADLTSDGGFTSPTRTNTPSPPLPAIYAPVPPLSLNLKSHLSKQLDPDHHIAPHVLEQPKAEVVTPAVPKKRCITFACAAQKPKASPVPAKNVETAPTVEPTKRACTIKFACPGPWASESKPKAAPVRKPSPAPFARVDAKLPPAIPLVRTSSPSSESHIETANPVIVPNPISIRCGRPKFLSATEDELDSEATRFHEFASGQLHDDDWVRKDDSSHKEKLTINDTLRKENVFRQLGQEVEDEADDNEDELGDELGDETDDELDEDDEEEDEDEEDNFDVQSISSSIDEDASDGNETDNEAGFADSDDESDANGEYQFWTTTSRPSDVTHLRPATERRESISSIDSLKHMSPVQRRRSRSFKSKSIKIRPGTPDLPDSTDFVCGTLDEDRPLEDAYVSCMEARKRMRQHTIPQDIDPSFPTSDPENDDDNDSHHTVVSSDEHMFMHGALEDIEERPGRRTSVFRRSPERSPRLRSPAPQRLRSPAPKQRLRSPPPKQRLRSPPPIKRRLTSPPPRRLFGGSPRRLRSPPPARAVPSPPASPNEQPTAAITFAAPLGQRPEPTLTKSLPRAQMRYGRQMPCRLSSICDDGEESNSGEGHTRGAIDIVKGLEQKRQRRKEKFWQKHCNRARKGLPERRALPGQGCERMRELGLQMAGKNDTRSKKAEYVLSV